MHRGADPAYGRILVLQDITYLKELDTAKSNFVATVSHDLRAPLNSIAGFANALGDVGPLNPQQQEFAARIADMAERMTLLVTALLDIARVDSRLERNREACNIEALIHNVLTEMQGQAIAHGVELTADVVRSPVSLECDPTQIHQAISNLVDNAIKYSPSGGVVRVIVDTAGDDVLVTVSDSGKGIPQKDVPYIFDKFYRVKEKGHPVGVGLGRRLRSVAEAHGGAIRVESVENQGSTFTLRLPVSGGNGALPAARRRRPAEPAASSRLARTTGITRYGLVKIISVNRFRRVRCAVVADVEEAVGLFPRASPLCWRCCRCCPVAARRAVGAPVSRDLSGEAKCPGHRHFSRPSPRR